MVNDCGENEQGESITGGGRYKKRRVVPILDERLGSLVVVVIGKLLWR